MQDIVHSLASTFATCACGSRAKDCAVNLMAAFVDDVDDEGAPPVHTPNSAQSHAHSPYPFATTTPPPPPAPPPWPTSANAFGSVTTSGTSSPPSRHPSSLAALHALGADADLGQLVGARRGVRTHPVGGVNGEGLAGVELVDDDHEPPAPWDL